MSMERWSNEKVDDGGLVSRLRFNLADAASRQSPPTPLKVKQVLDRELVESGADFLTSTAIRRVIRDGGRITGVETVNRSGREIVRAKEVVDATLYGLLGKIPAVGGEEIFSRIVIANDSRPSLEGMTVASIPTSATSMTPTRATCGCSCCAPAPVRRRRGTSRSSPILLALEALGSPEAAKPLAWRFMPAEGAAILDGLLRAE